VPVHALQTLHEPLVQVLLRVCGSEAQASVGFAAFHIVLLCDDVPPDAVPSLQGLRQLHV